MTNAEISKLLEHVAAAYSIKDEKKYRFQIIAYQKAADALEHSPVEAKELYKEGKLTALPGVGPSIHRHLEELFTTGKVAHFEEVLQAIPASVYPLLDVTSFGPKTAYKLVSEFKLNDPATVVEELEAIAKAGKIAGLPGFGEKAQQKIIQVINEYKLGKTKNQRMVLPYASELAKKMLAYLEQCDAVIRASTLGSLRRRRETVGDIDIAVATNDPEKVLEHFVAYPHAERVIEKGDRTSSIITGSGRQVDLMTQPPEAFGSLLQHFTGSKAHNVHLRELALSKGLSLSEYGIKKKGGTEFTKYETEESFYAALGLDWIPPEIREDAGEIELAGKHALPKLVELKDIKGDFHLHSSYPIEPSHDMGQNSMDEMIAVAKERKYEYVGFSEHSPSVSKHTNEQIVDLVRKRSIFIDHKREKYKNSIRIFSLLEVDILASGKLALPDEALQLLDGAIVSIHSAFDMDKETMTNRVLQGLSHPKAKILAHPSGRLINQRSGYELDWDKVFAFAKEHNKALEINAWPLRLDLRDVLVQEAKKHGLKFFIDTDSHAIEHMSLMEFGVSVARRGWATPNDILNTWDYNDLKEWFRG